MPGLSLAGVRLGFTHMRGFPCCSHYPLSYMPSPLPRLTGAALRSSHRTSDGLPCRNVRSAQQHRFSRPTQCSLPLGPARSLIPQGNLCRRRLQPLHYFHGCSNCYRPERQGPGGFRTHWAVQPFHGAHYGDDYGGRGRETQGKRESRNQCASHARGSHPHPSSAWRLRAVARTSRSRWAWTD